MKKKTEDEKDVRQGNVVAEDQEMATWLQSLWAESRKPTRLELWQVTGRNMNVHGRQIHTKDFSQKGAMNIEDCVALTNDLIRRAQRDCDVSERKSAYKCSIFDDFQKAASVDYIFGPLRPKRFYNQKVDGTIAVDESDSDDEDEDSPDTFKSVAMKYLKEDFKHSRWATDRNDIMLGQVLDMFVEDRRESRSWINELRQEIRMNAMAVQDAIDRSVDRKIATDKADMWIGLTKYGVETGMNMAVTLLPSVFKPKQIANGSAKGKETVSSSLVSDAAIYTVLQNFTKSCEESGVSEQIFGDWEEFGKCKTPGILKPEQAFLMFAVINKDRPPSTLTALLPDSGTPLAIPPDQTMQIIPLLNATTREIIMNLIDLIKKSREAQQKGTVS